MVSTVFIACTGGWNVSGFGAHRWDGLLEGGEGRMMAMMIQLSFIEVIFLSHIIIIIIIIIIQLVIIR
jgi:hypothetical protein